jgi:hypothetical protein
MKIRRFTTDGAEFAEILRVYSVATVVDSAFFTDLR